MSAFSAAIDRIFADPNMAADANWISQGVAAAVACRVILKSPDELSEFGSAQIVSDTVMGDVRVSEVPEPETGDRFDIGTDRYFVQGKPRRDRERLVWTMELLPECR